MRLIAMDEIRIFVLLSMMMGMISAGNHASVLAQNPEIRISVSAEEVFLGESIDLQVEIQNAEDPTLPDLTEWRERFDIAELGNQSRNQSSIVILNGQMTRETVYSHVYQFRLTPKVDGEFLMPALKATLNGKMVTSKRVPIRVLPVEKQSVVLIEITSDRAKIYPTQSFTVNLKVLIRPLPGNPNADPLGLLRRPPQLECNWVEIPNGLGADDPSQWLRPLMARGTVGFTLNNISASSGFFGESRSAVFDLAQGKEKREISGEGEIDYHRYELKRLFVAEKTGEYSFGPAMVRGTFVGVNERGEAATKRIVAIAPALKVEVSEVPNPRPLSYCGGIGNFQITTSATPMKVRVGDPVTLTLEIQPSDELGSLESVFAPDFSKDENLLNDFELIDTKPVGKIEGKSKRFTYALRPKKVGIEIPPLRVSTFDPDTEKFQEWKSGPIPIEVSEASKISSVDLIGTIPSGAAISEMKSNREGIFQNITDSKQIQNQAIPLRRRLWTTLGVWLGTILLFGMLLLIRRKTSDRVAIRRSRARRQAMDRLVQAEATLRSGDARGALKQIRMSLIGLLADTQNRVAEGLTPKDFLDSLPASVQDIDRQTIENLLEAMDASEFGGITANDVSSMVEETRRWIQRVAPKMERSQ